MTITCILAPFSVIFILLNLMKNTSSNQMITMISKILPSVCFVFGIIGVALGISYTTNGNNESYVELGAAGILGILAVIFNFSAAVIATFIQ
jgi:tetrahydromethanopterin S-methyltransferase subunit D